MQALAQFLLTKKDGIARGSGLLTTLADDIEHRTILNGKASAHYSFDKGSSRQNYPSSLMGSIALLKQTYLDAEWYDQLPESEYNRSRMLLEHATGFTTVF